MLGKLFGLASIGSTLASVGASVGLMRQFLQSLATVIILAVISAFMICLLILGAFYLFYIGLMHYGLDAVAAGVVVGCTAILITITFIALTIDRMRSLKELPYHNLQRNMSSFGSMFDVGGVAEAFIDGLLSRRK